ncbi:MAG: tetratricopeptide repeat protein [Paludibacteraceae bacterium]|nr:tetratricopeptide repeat protein [Paludibacteraceae bacterium]
MKRWIAVIVAVLLTEGMMCYAQQEGTHVKAGNRLYEKERYQEAEIEYRRGLGQNANSFESRYNLGNALYKQQKYKEATEAYLKASESIHRGDIKEKARLADSFYNLGNALYRQRDFKNSIEAYKNALRLNPQDEEARFNLALAKKHLNETSSPQRQQQKEQQNNEQQKREEKKEPEKEQDENKMSKDQAEQILNALMEDEKDLQKKVKRNTSKKKRLEKDW